MKIGFSHASRDGGDKEGWREEKLGKERLPAFIELLSLRQTDSLVM
jgi:hypothetical protein